MGPVTNFLIVLAVLVILLLFVVTALSKRAKNDPKSLENRFYRGLYEVDDIYDTGDHRDESMRVSRAARPAYPDINDPKYMVAWAKEKDAEEKMKMQKLEDIELWEEDHR